MSNIQWTTHAHKHAHRHAQTHAHIFYTNSDQIQGSKATKDRELLPALENCFCSVFYCLRNEDDDNDDLKYPRYDTKNRKCFHAATNM